MNRLKGLLESFDRRKHSEAIVWNDVGYTYGWLKNKVEELGGALGTWGLKSGAVVELNADFTPTSVALLLALIQRDCIIAPTTNIPALKREEFRRIAQAEWAIDVGSDDGMTVQPFGVTPGHELLLRLKRDQVPGLVIFSSGSSGKPKAGVHDFSKLLEKFDVPRKTARVLAFLLFDHIGGLNTLFYTLFNSGTVIVPKSRSPQNVCEAIEIHKATALTTTPTFLQLMLLSTAARLHDLSSLRIINYGSEVMPGATLSRLHELYPLVRLSQGYGLSEVGVVPTESRSSDSLLVKLKNQDGFEYRIVEGLLEIKSRSAMMGYLNATAPFTPDGWFKTGDAVEQHGEYVRILGRVSEMINVGGQKVYPAEVENVIQQMSGVENVAVRGEKNALLGNVVVATITLAAEEKPLDFRRRMEAFARDRLPAFMVPQKVILTHRDLHGERFKKMRNQIVEGQIA